MRTGLPVVACAQTVVVSAGESSSKPLTGTPSSCRSPSCRGFFSGSDRRKSIILLIRSSSAPPLIEPTSAVLVLLIAASDLPATKSSIANPPASDSGNNNSCRDLPGDMKYSRLLRKDLPSAVEVMTESKEIVLAARSFSATCAQATDDPAGPANTTNIVNLIAHNPTRS